MKTALVTGASRGIGAEVARALRAAGWSVTGLARGPAAPELEEDLGYRHERLDLSDSSAALAWAEDRFLPALAEAPTRFALINNAGTVAPVKPVTRLEPAEWSQALSLNVVTPACLSAFVLRSFRDVPLRIVDLSSGAATTAYPAWGPYCASKSALRMLGQVIHQEVQSVESSRHPDFALVSYAPGVVATQMQEELRAVDPALFPPKQRFVDLHEGGRLVDPAQPAAEIATLVDRDDLPAWSERRYGS